MTFSELVEAVEAAVPKGVYSITVEFSQNTQYQTCAHVPALKRKLEWKIWDGKNFHEGDSAEEAFCKFRDASSPKDATVANPLLIDAHNVKMEVQL
jgi:hypothetical protein